MSDRATRVKAHFNAGEFTQCRELALEGVASSPDDIELLRYAGRSGVELGSDDATDQLRRVVELQPDAESWRDLGDALATEGRTEEENEAFRKVLELNPDDEPALTNLGHLAYASGNRNEGVSLLSQAAEHAARASTAAISLVDMYRTLGQPEEALAAAQRIAAAAPDDVIALLDVAELSLAVGKLDQAAEAFARIREVDDVPGHEVYPLHGLIQVEIRREAWKPALCLAEEATVLDPRGRSAEIASFLAAKVSGPGEEPAPSAAEVDDALAISLAECRRMHAGSRSFPPKAPA